MYEELQEIQQGQKQNRVPVISLSSHTAGPKSLGRSSAKKDQGLLVDVWLKQWTLERQPRRFGLEKTRLIWTWREGSRGLSSIPPVLTCQLLEKKSEPGYSRCCTVGGWEITATSWNRGGSTWIIGDKKGFHFEDKVSEQAIWRGCGRSVLRDFLGFGQHGLNSLLTLLWAGAWTRDLLSSLLTWAIQWLYIRQPKIHTEAPK